MKKITFIIVALLATNLAMAHKTGKHHQHKKRNGKSQVISIPGAPDKNSGSGGGVKAGKGITETGRKK